MLIILIFKFGFYLIIFYNIFFIEQHNIEKCGEYLTLEKKGCNWGTKFGCCCSILVHTFVRFDLDCSVQLESSNSNI